jgi:hypothetical protein
VDRLCDPLSAFTDCALRQSHHVHGRQAARDVDFDIDEERVDALQEPLRMRASMSFSESESGTI